MTQELREIESIILKEMDKWAGRPKGKITPATYIAQAILKAGYTKKPRVDVEKVDKLLREYLKPTIRITLDGRDALYCNYKETAKALAESDILESGE